MKSKIIKYGYLFGLLIIVSSCLEERNTLEVGVHPSDWMTSSSEQHHGASVAGSPFGAENCQSCHGDNYDGGTSKVSCYDSQCHASYPHPANFATSRSSHAEYIRETVNWDITTCQPCHGTNYNRQIADELTCSQCHNPTADVVGPENCTTCHGNSLSGNSAPPEDLDGNAASVAIGAHSSHLIKTTWSTHLVDNCSVCHTEVITFSDAGHVNDGTEHAEVVFSLGDGSGTWDRTSNTCDNVYCHGSEAVVWTDAGDYEASCGTCHGLPPAAPHTARTDCESCHGSVVNIDGEIIDKALHINGAINMN